MAAIPDPRTRRLHAYDGHAADFADDCARRAQAGRVIAVGDTEVLMGLARAIETQARGWRDAVRRLELAATRELDPDRAAALIVETVFEDVLSEPGWRVLSAGVELALG